jgi:magnesium chelatase subunit I
MMAEVINYPLLALVGQEEMKTALILAAINPRVRGVLLLGPRGTGKTTAARGLVDLLPPVPRSICPHGCEPGLAAISMEYVCPDCAAKLEAGEDITYPAPMQLVELPLNATMDDVIGGPNPRIALEQSRWQLQQGILYYAHRNVLYVDEINLLDEDIVNCILDAASRGYYVVRRGRLIGTFPSEFLLIGSMNPEEGALRPQLMDRLGLRVVVAPLQDPDQRLEVYERNRLYADDSVTFAAGYAEETMALAEEIAQAKELLPRVTISPEIAQSAMKLINSLIIQSHRAEIVLLEASRAHAAADGRTEVENQDIAVAAPLALRQRRSDFMERFVSHSREEDERIAKETQEILGIENS